MSTISYGFLPCASTLDLLWRKSTCSNNSSNCVEVASSLPNAAWRKSSRSGTTNNCVQLATNLHIVGVRDSKDPHGPALTVAPAVWSAFLRNVGAVRP